MNFAETRFWQLLVSALGLILLGRVFLTRVFPSTSAHIDKIALLGLGMFLLLSVSWVTFAIFLVVAVSSYVGLAWIIGHHRRRAAIYLLILIPLQLAPLVYYKYADFIANRVIGLQIPALHDLAIPVGISFYTFQKVAFVIDTLALNRPLPRFLDYMNFAGFFPQIVAGPIERRQDLLPQMEKFRFRWLPVQIDDGARWIALGLFFKRCLADNIAPYVDISVQNNPYLIWLANLSFGLRIYYDFAGYSLIAVGLGRCLGIRLTLNFLSPYCACSSVEFWRRWHITLSRWFRDYLYIPLGGGRTKYWAGTVAVVFIVSGIWHGAGWNFLIWGAMHAAFLIINRTAAKLSLPGPLGWGLTMLATFFAWVSFYESRTEVLITKLRVLLSPAAYHLASLRAAVNQIDPGHGTTLVGLLIFSCAVLVLEWLSVRRKNEAYYYLRQPAAVVSLVFLTVLLAPGHNNAFIYFAF